MKIKKIYSKIIISLCLMISIISIPDASANVYISANLGAIQTLEGQSNSHGLFGAAIGYNFPVLIKTEIFYKNYTNHMLGAALRVSPLPLLSISVGAFKQISSVKTVSDENGIFIAPGLNFNWIPLIDIFADIGVYRIAKVNFAAAELGLRVHF